MSDNNYIKYITGQVVAYLDMTTEERRKKREVKRGRKNSYHLSHPWLGMLPISLKILRKND